jgi:hypothetical protein
VGLAVRRKRETLTGDATIRYFDYLDGFDHFDGLLANLFTGERPVQGHEHEAGWHAGADKPGRDCCSLNLQTVWQARFGCSPSVLQ